MKYSLVSLSSVLLVAILSPAGAQISRMDRRFSVQSDPATKPAVRSGIRQTARPAVQRIMPSKNGSSPYVTLDRLYNGEKVELPKWFYDEVESINELLKAKLSPSDYLEILKGEKELYGQFKTKDEYEAHVRKVNIGGWNSSCKLISELKKKLNQILNNPSDVELFARPHFLAKRNTGVSFRENIRYTNDGYPIIADEEYIVTSRNGKSHGCSYIWVFWDARTGKVCKQFYCPTDILENAIFARKSAMGNIYVLGNAFVETSGRRWNDSMTGSYLVAPQVSMFQSCNYSHEAGLEIYSYQIDSVRVKKDWQAGPGDVSKACGRIPNYFLYSMDLQSSELPAPWYRRRECGLDKLYMRTSNPAKFHSEDGKYANADFTKFTLSDKKSRGFDLMWDSLEIMLSEKKELIKNDKDKEKKIWHSLRPIPISKWNETVEEKHEDDSIVSFLQVEHTDTPNILFSAYNEIDGRFTSGILGMYTAQGVFLFPSITDNDDTVSILPYEGKVERYQDCLAQSTQKGNLGKYELTPCSWQKLKVHQEEKGSNTLLLEIVYRKEEDRVDYREELRLVELNLQDRTFKTIRHWEYYATTLPACWISGKNWFLKPESDFQYSIIESKEGEAERKVADFFVDPAQGYAIVLQDGRYAGSPGCESFLEYGDGERVMGMAALAPWRNRPAEVLEAIGGNADDIAALKETTKRWLSKQGFDPENMPAEPKLCEFPAAEVDMPDLFSKGDTARFSVKLKATAQDIRKLEVRADGVLIPQAWDGSLSVAAGTEKEVTVEVPLACGQNWIEVTPVDAAGISGDTSRFRTIYKGNYPSDLFIVALGVSNYDDPDLQLQYAAKDAKDIAAAFEKYGTGRKHTLVLTDKEVQDKSVLEKVKIFLSAASLEDRVVFYVAGHGMLDDKLNYYYAPAGFDAERISETGIPMEDLTACLHGTEARHRLLLLDTCHSGELGEEGEDKLALEGVKLPHGVRAIRHRGMKTRKAVGALNTTQKKRYIEDMFSRGSTERGINIIAGAAGAEYALESELWQNGVFTAALLQALRDQQSDENEDGKVSVEELQRVITHKVAELTGGAQRPGSVASEGSEGFVILQNAREESPHVPPTPEGVLAVLPEAEISAVSPAEEELKQIISNLRSTTYQSSVERLYQKRLLQLLEMILNGASVNTVLPNANGTTALHNACGLSRVDVVRWLVENGADLNARTAKGASVDLCVGGTNAAAINKILRDARRKNK